MTSLNMFSSFIPDMSLSFAMLLMNARMPAMMQETDFILVKENSLEAALMRDKEKQVT